MRNLLNLCKYELSDWNSLKGWTGRRWLGPRGKQLSGTGKALARLLWDRQRFK